MSSEICLFEQPRHLMSRHEIDKDKTKIRLGFFYYYSAQDAIESGIIVVVDIGHSVLFATTSRSDTTGFDILPFAIGPLVLAQSASRHPIPHLEGAQTDIAFLSIRRHDRQPSLLRAPPRPPHCAPSLHSRLHPIGQPKSSRPVLLSPRRG